MSTKEIPVEELEYYDTFYWLSAPVTVTGIAHLVPEKLWAITAGFRTVYVPDGTVLIVQSNPDFDGVSIVNGWVQ